jgi:hypothetical protein
MNQYVGIDVSLEASSVCIVDGQPVRADRLAKQVFSRANLPLLRAA